LKSWATPPDRFELLGLAQLALRFLQGRGNPALLGAHGGGRQLAFEDGGQPVQPRFDDEVVGASAHRGHRVFLAARAGHDDERQIRVEELDQLERLFAAESRHRVVGDHDVEVAGDEGVSEFGPGVDSQDVGVEPFPLQLALQQLRVVVGVFNHQDGDGT
jgi:hypothetical protein